MWRQRMIEQSFSHCGRIHRGERADTACSSRYARRQTSNRYSNIQFNLTLPKTKCMDIFNGCTHLSVSRQIGNRSVNLRFRNGIQVPTERDTDSLLPISKLYSNTPSAVMNTKLSMQTKLNGVPFQDMIIYHLSLDQVSTVVRLRFHDHVYIKLIKIHTKRMTTSNFAGRAAHDCKSAIFNVRRVVFELFTDTLGPVSSSKHSSTYRENKDTRNRNAIVQLITASSMRQVLNLENFNGSDITRSSSIPSNRRTSGCTDFISSRLQKHTNSSESASGMRRAKIQADEFRDTVINKPGTGHSDRPTKPVLRVPCLASEYCIHQAYKAPHCV